MTVLHQMKLFRIYDTLLKDRQERNLRNLYHWYGHVFKYSLKFESLFDSIVLSNVGCSNV